MAIHKQADFKDCADVPFDFSLYSKTSSNEENQNYRDSSNSDTEFGRVCLQYKNQQLNTTSKWRIDGPGVSRLTCMVTPMKQKKSNLSKQIMIW